MKNQTKGYLLIIGGAEDKEGESVILRAVLSVVSEEEILTVITTATEKPKEVGENYRRVFEHLGLRNVQLLHIHSRETANDSEVCAAIARTRCIFFTGGDQLRITSILGGTKALAEVKGVYASGGLIMGTSAGASAMSATMVVDGDESGTPRKCTLKMAPGLDLLSDTIIDQHFGQRGRFSRLVCGVAENPDVLGIGIDEDTAVKVYPDQWFEVIGTNSVTVIDGTTIESSNVSEQAPDEVLAIIGATVHTLPMGYGFDMKTRTVKRIKTSTQKNSEPQAGAKKIEA